MIVYYYLKERVQNNKMTRIYLLTGDMRVIYDCTKYNIFQYEFYENEMRY